LLIDHLAGQRASQPESHIGEESKSIIKRYEAAVSANKSNRN
jgi:hypothetical protein